MVMRAAIAVALTLTAGGCHASDDRDLPAEALRVAEGEAQAGGARKGASDASARGEAAPGGPRKGASDASARGEAPPGGPRKGASDAAARAASNATPPLEAGSPPELGSFGTPIAVDHATCGAFRREGNARSFLAPADTRWAFVDGNDPLAIVNRSPTGALPPTYAPSDLVDVRDGSARRPSECDGRNCLRRDARDALRRMLEAMSTDGVEGHVQSAFRAFATQCWVFAGWARQARGGFCEATEQSALPGHSQHQLGTTLDLFTKEWADEGAKRGQGVFRDGFGCSRGGKWLDEQAWRFGFVVPYPIHPDDRKEGSRCAVRDASVPIDPQTGYKHEPWHVRYIGVEDAARYHAKWLASSPGSPQEITLEQWLRSERGLVGDAELPVCDGCNCGACSTLASEDANTPCGKASLQLDSSGRAVAPWDPPRILEARIVRDAGRTVVEVTVRASAHTPTQTPVLGAGTPGYGDGATFLALSPEPNREAHSYPDLPGTWRVAIEPTPPASLHWPWRASLAAGELGAIWNRANLVLPAKAGEAVVRVPVALSHQASGVRVALIRDGVASDERSVTVP